MEEERDRTLWCGNMDSQVTENLLYELFIQAGPLENVRIPKDSSGRPRSYAFVTFKHPQSVGYALALMNGINLFGKSLKLQRRPDSAVDDTYVNMMAKHAEYMNTVKSQRVQALVCPVPSPFMADWMYDRQQQVYGFNFNFPNVDLSRMGGKHVTQQYPQGVTGQHGPGGHWGKNRTLSYKPPRGRGHGGRWHDVPRQRRNAYEPYRRGRH